MNGIDHEYDASMSGSTVQDEWEPWIEFDATADRPDADPGYWEIRLFGGRIVSSNVQRLSTMINVCGSRSIADYRLRKPATPPDGNEDTRQFKNFHRMLSERFGYTHDEVDWRRDQVSLMEWIAKKAATTPDLLRDALDALKSAEEEFSRIECEGVTETRSISEVVERCIFFAGRGAMSVRKAIKRARKAGVL